MPKCDLNEVALLCNFILLILRHRRSLVNELHIFRIPFPKSFSGWLLLFIVNFEHISHLVLLFLLLTLSR